MAAPLITGGMTRQFWISFFGSMLGVIAAISIALALAGFAVGAWVASLVGGRADAPPRACALSGSFWAMRWRSSAPRRDFSSFTSIRGAAEIFTRSGYSDAGREAAQAQLPVRHHGRRHRGRPRLVGAQG